MAKRYFNIFKSHIVMLALVVALICTAEFTVGMVSTIVKIATGVVLIYLAIRYAIWLVKSPTAKIKEESL